MNVNDHESHSGEGRRRLTAELQERSMQLFVTLASIGDAVITTDSSGDITFLNPMAESLTGWILEDAIGADIEEVFRLVCDTTGDEMPGTVRQAIKTVAKVILPPEALLVRKDGTRIPIDDSAAPIVDMNGEVLGAVLVFRDITEKRRAAQVIKYRSELDRMAARISTAFITSPVENVEKQINSALEEIGRFLKADRSYIVLYNHDHMTQTFAHEWTAPGISPVSTRTQPISVAPLWTDQIIARHHVYISSLDEIPKDATAEGILWRERGLVTIIAVPMMQEDKVLGFIGIESVTGKRRWPEDIINLLYLIGNVFASALGRRAAMIKLEEARAREVAIGSRIQQTLLLGDPPSAFADFQVAALTIPSWTIDGDFYDFLQHPNQCLDVIFGDVMGKGVPAALLAAGSKTEFLRSLSHLLTISKRGSIPRPQDIVNTVHGVLTPQLMSLDSFVTISYVRFDPQAARVLLVDCGNTRLLKCAAKDGEVEFLSGYNVPLGFSLLETYSEASFDYQHGDVFVLYSDGATEARDCNGQMFGIDRLREVISLNRHGSSRQIIQAIEDKVTEFVGMRALSDDFTCVVVKIVPEHEQCILPACGELQVTSNLIELATIRDFVKSYCAQRMESILETREFNLLQLAVTEVASNIIKHAYKKRKNQPIWVRMEVTDQSLKINFRHLGQPFSLPDRIQTPEDDRVRESGFGLYIIKHAVDDVVHGVDNQGLQYIELTKNIRKRGVSDEI